MTYPKTGVCSINPEHTYTDYGHNADPVNSGRCCEVCNYSVVLPARIARSSNLGRMLRAIPSENRKLASRLNGKLGGRPRGSKNKPKQI